MNLLNILYEQLSERNRLHSFWITCSTQMLASQANNIEKQYGFNDFQLFNKAVADGCKFHDIGKLLGPSLILEGSNDTIRLCEDLSHLHPIHSEHLTVRLYGEYFPSESYLQVVSDICMYHHEKYNGSGYPYKLEGDDIPLLSQLCNIAHILEKYLTSHYKPSDMHEYLQKHMKEECMQSFGKEAFDCFDRSKEQIYDFYAHLPIMEKNLAIHY